MQEDTPLDPFRGDPADPARQLDDDATDVSEPLGPGDREDVLADIEDLEVFQTLLEPRGTRGLVVECGDCDEQHYYGWELLRGNLRQLLDDGRIRVHEPACQPESDRYVSWDYARGFADAVLAADEG